MCSFADAACTLYDKGKEVGTKYGLFDKMKAAASATKAKLSEINDEYKITDKVNIYNFLVRLRRHTIPVAGVAGKRSRLQSISSGERSRCQI